jgi:hypothetical protein
MDAVDLPAGAFDGEVSKHGIDAVATPGMGVLDGISHPELLAAVVEAGFIADLVSELQNFWIGGLRCVLNNTPHAALRCCIHNRIKIPSGSRIIQGSTVVGNFQTWHDGPSGNPPQTGLSALLCARGSKGCYGSSAVVFDAPRGA